ncbi:MAG: LutB/LldF family L-lactate oxidation iron-sulfur protein [Acidimicrobiia bacterium]|nr:LutB/LldF family L-lactate oxidation iron-sulfur protein [Acidimicrobiia bacterium]
MTTFRERIQEAFAEGVPISIDLGSRGRHEHRVSAAAAFPQMEEMRDRARTIRAEVVASLDEQLGRFADAAERAGSTVFFAADATEAREYIVELARTERVTRAVKVKSMVTEEIDLNAALESAGVEAIETDLGEFIVQLAGQPPAHFIAPAIHKDRYEIADLFVAELGVDYSDDPVELNNIARRHLRPRFLTAEMGISGVNFGVAADGSVALVTNEGNGRLCTTAPRIHVAVMGMERVVPTRADLAVMLEVLARSATGQSLSSYTNLVTGPRRSGEPDGPDQLHVVIVDNGRSATLGSSAAEILYCIRCGACLNTCPVYRHLGGHPYGSVYAGPIGKVVTPSLFGLEDWHDLPATSSLCGACEEVCPVRIDIPRLLVELRRQSVDRSTPAVRRSIRLYASLTTRPRLFRLLTRVAARLGRLWSRDGWLRRLPGVLGNWTQHRDLPAPAPETFSDWWRRNRGA